MGDGNGHLLRSSESTTWDDGVVQELLLNERDMKLMLQLPLSTRGKEDAWMWHLDARRNKNIPLYIHPKHVPNIET